MVFSPINTSLRNVEAFLLVWLKFRLFLGQMEEKVRKRNKL